MEKKYYLTPAGYQKYKKEYEKLKKLWHEKRKKMKETRDELWRPEDLNPDYGALKAELEYLEKKIKHLETMLKNAVVARPHRNLKKVSIGSTVVVEVEGQIDELTIVGTLEANPSEGKISNECPVGKALLGHKVGDEVIISSPIKVKYKILKIKPYKGD